MQDFFSGNTVVVVHSVDELYQLMDLCEETGIKWSSGHAPMEFAPRCVWNQDRLWIYTVCKDGESYLMYGRQYAPFTFAHRKCVDFSELEYDTAKPEDYIPIDMTGLFEA